MKANESGYREQQNEYLEIWVHPRVGVVGWLGMFGVIRIWVGGLSSWAGLIGWGGPKMAPDHS